MIIVWNMINYALFRLTSNSSRLSYLLQKMYKLGDKLGEPSKLVRFV